MPRILNLYSIQMHEHKLRKKDIDQRGGEVINKLIDVEAKTVSRHQ